MVRKVYCDIYLALPITVHVIRITLTVVMSVFLIM